MHEYAEHRLVHACRFSNTCAVYPTRVHVLVVELAVCVHATVWLYTSFSSSDYTGYMIVFHYATESAYSIQYINVQMLRCIIALLLKVGTKLAYCINLCS